MAIANIRNVKISVAVLAWVGILLAATHRSHPPVVLGRYSWNYAAVLGLLVGVAVTLSLAKSAWYVKLCQVRAGIIVSGVSLLLSSLCGRAGQSYAKSSQALLTMTC